MFIVDKKQIHDLGKEAYVAHCLMEMTTEGFYEEEIQEKFLEIQEATENFVVLDKIDFENNKITIENFISEDIRRRKELNETK